MSDPLTEHPLPRSKSIVVPFGCKKSWKSMQTQRHEAKAMKKLEKEMKESVLQAREVCVMGGA